MPGVEEEDEVGALGVKREKVEAHVTGSRVSVSSESLLALKEVLTDLNALKKVHLRLEGTRCDPMTCKQLEKVLSNAKSIPDVLITF